MDSDGIDLHCHSRASDGTLSPTALVAAAHAAGVRMLALTDHDTLAGLDAARAAAATRNMHFINGVEISTRWGTRTIHIVGLDFDAHCAALLDGLAGLQAQRRQRARAIAAKLENFGVTDALRRARYAADGGQITRTHFARLLVEDGLCQDARRAFRRILGDGKPGCVATPWVSIDAAVAWIRAAKGQAVLAHPQCYRLSRTKFDCLLDTFTAAGGTALEVCCGNSKDADVVRATSAARRHGLFGSAGSDFHDPAHAWRHLGGTAPMPSSVTPVWHHFRDFASTEAVP